jgi:hypothetical protein
VGVSHGKKSANEKGKFMLNKLWFFAVPLMMMSSISSAMTVVSGSQTDITQNVNATSTQFELSGTIVQYDQERSLILVNDKQYIVDGMGMLSPTDLKKGQFIKFNLEQSSTDNIGHITKIWIETKVK